MTIPISLESLPSWTASFGDPDAQCQEAAQKRRRAKSTAPRTSSEHRSTRGCSVGSGAKPVSGARAAHAAVAAELGA